MGKLYCSSRFWSIETPSWSQTVGILRAFYSSSWLSWELRNMMQLLKHVHYFWIRLKAAFISCAILLPSPRSNANSELSCSRIWILVLQDLSAERIAPMKKGNIFYSQNWSNAAQETAALPETCRQIYVDVVGGGLLVRLLLDTLHSELADSRCSSTKPNSSASLLDWC